MWQEANDWWDAADAAATEVAAAAGRAQALQQARKAADMNRQGFARLGLCQTFFFWHSMPLSNTADPPMRGA